MGVYSATRVGDKNTGHDACPAVPLEVGSSNVFINNKPAGRLNDTYESHGCIVHSPHHDYISSGSTTVFINNLPAGRVGDSVEIAGNVAEGSSNVFIGG